MDGRTFDALARMLAGDADRRSVVKRLLAGALAGSFALRGATVGATDDDGGSSCPLGSKRCGDACIPNAQCCDGGVPGCPADETCSDGICGVATTPGGPGTGCDIDADCTADCTCAGGTCACNPGTKRCGNTCVPDSRCCTDGAAGCPAGETCSDGLCAGGSTPGGPGSGCDDEGDCSSDCTCIGGTCACKTGCKRCGTVCIPTSACCHDGQPGCSVNDTCSANGTCAAVAPPTGGGTGGGGTPPSRCRNCKRECERVCRANGRRDRTCRRDCTKNRCEKCRTSSTR